MTKPKINLDIPVIWTECCGHYFPKRVPEEYSTWTDPVDGDVFEEGSGQVAEFWEHLKGKKGRLVFIPEEDKQE